MCALSYQREVHGQSRALDDALHLITHGAVERAHESVAARQHREDLRDAIATPPAALLVDR